MEPFTKTFQSIKRLKDIIQLDKLVLCDIISLFSIKGEVWVKNKTLADDNGVCDRQISRSIARLFDTGYITIANGQGGNRQIFITNKTRQLVGLELIEGENIPTKEEVIIIETNEVEPPSFEEDEDITPTEILETKVEDEKPIVDTPVSNKRTSTINSKGDIEVWMMSHEWEYRKHPKWPDLNEHVLNDEIFDAKEIIEEIELTTVE